MSNVRVLDHVHVVVVASMPSLRVKAKGRRLIKKAVFTAVLTWKLKRGVREGVLRDEKRGYNKATKIRTRLEICITNEYSMAFTWSCTKELDF